MPTGGPAIDRPSGTVTFLFTDIEGSTRLWDREPQKMAAALRAHDEIIGGEVGSRRGWVFKHTGDGVLAAFDAPSDAFEAGLAIQLAFVRHDWGGLDVRTRTVVHTGEAEQRESDYFGPALNRASRLLEATHGGQFLVSEPTEALIRGALPIDTDLINLGRQRLRDLAEAQEIFQVMHPDLRAEFPRLRTLESFPNNLPVQLTNFIGRERQLEEVTAWLEEVRLLTFTGVGGVGKSRMALQLGADLIDDFPDGVWLVELAALTAPEQLAKAVAETLRVPEDPTRPVLDTLLDELTDRRTLLILDNCEHLIGAVAEFADRILRRCRRVRVLATSREGLGIPGERVFRVPSLSLPPWDAPLEDVLASESAALFVERATAVRPGFEPSPAEAAAITEICHRLDGIALAIELAAARLTMFSIEQIAARLDDRFRLLTGGSRTALPRQRTLLAAMDWSHGLLPDMEKLLLRRIAVFQGGLTLEAAEEVCSGDDMPPGVILDRLRHLVEASLVIPETGQVGRFRMLETVRQYALDRLADSGEADAVRRNHAAYFAGRVAGAEDRLLGSEQVTLLEEIAREHDNLRAAIAWSLEAGEPELGLHIAADLGRYWHLHGRNDVGRKYLEKTLRAAPDDPSPQRVDALRHLAYIIMNMGENEEAERVADQAVDMAIDLADERRVGRALFAGAMAASSSGELEHAAAMWQEAFEVSQRADDPMFASLSLANLAGLARRTGDPQRAQELTEDLLRVAKKHGDDKMIGLAKSFHAVSHLYRDDVDRFLAEHREGLRLLRRAGAPLLEYQLAANGAFAVALMGHLELAEELAADIIEPARLARSPEAEMLLPAMSGMLAYRRGDLDAAGTAWREARDGFAEIGAQERVDEIDLSLGWVELHRGDPAAAGRIASRVLQDATRRGSPHPQIGAYQLLARIDILGEESAAAWKHIDAALGLARRLDHTPSLPDTLEIAACAFNLEGDPESAIRTLAAADARHRQTKTMRSPHDDALYRACYDSLQAAVDAATFAARWEEGEQTPIRAATDAILGGVGVSA